jgi:hypothetical protein
MIRMVTIIDKKTGQEESVTEVQFLLNSDKQFIIKLFDKTDKKKDVIISFNEEETKKMLSFIHEDLSW